MKQNPIIGCMRWGVWGENFSTAQYDTIINQCLEIGLTEFDHAVFKCLRPTGRSMPLSPIIQVPNI